MARKILPGLLAVLFSAAAFAQPDPFTSELQSRLNAYYLRSPLVRLHLTFNQSTYAPGDTAYFKGYFLGGTDLKPVAGRRVVSIKLMDQQQQVLHQRVLFQNGQCGSQVILPRTLSPGLYQLIAYDEMSFNQDPANYFHREFSIAGETQFRARKDYAIKIFPEGGHVVAGVRNTIVIIPAAIGTGMPASLKVVDGSDSVLQQVSIASQGVGSFDLIPSPGHSYHLQAGDQHIELPAVEPDGVAMTVTDTGDAYRVSLWVPVRSALKGHPAHLVAGAYDKIFFSQPVDLAQETTTVMIPKDLCSAGVARLTLFTDQYKVLAERSVWTLKQQNVDVEVALKNDYATRQQAEGAISIKDSAGNPLIANYSVSVFKNDLFRDAGNSIDAMQMYDLDGDHTIINRLLNDPANLMLAMATIQPRSMRWQRILDPSPPAVTKSFPSFFTGKVSHLTNQKVVPDSTMITFYLHKDDFVFGVYTRNNGAFDFPLFKDFENEEIFYTISHKGKMMEDASVSIGEQPLSLTPVITEKDTTRDAYGYFSTYRSLITASFQYYTKEHREADAPEEDELGEAEYGVDLDKFKPFATMTDVLSNVVSMVQFRKNDDNGSIRIFMKKTATYAHSNPVFVIDGVMTDNIDYFLSLDPASVSKIKVMRSEENLSRFGDLGKNGMLLVETKDRSAVLRTSRTLYVTGITKSIPYRKKIHQPGLRVRQPDLRSTLFWSTEVNSTLSFYTGDATGPFNVRVEGMTDTGFPFVYEKPFTVSFEVN